jgi:hypothetical protein
LNDIINNDLKVKVKALKSKLKEKVNQLANMEKEFESFKIEKEKTIVKILQNNQKIIYEKNGIINDLISK